MGVAVPSRLVHGAFAGAALVAAVWFALPWAADLVGPRERLHEVDRVTGRVRAGSGGQSPAWAQGAMRSGAIKPLMPAELAKGGVLLRVRDESGAADASRPIYLASSRNNWGAADEHGRLTPVGDGVWEIFIPFDASSGAGSEPFSFKFTMGSWTSVEVDRGGWTVRDRGLPLVDRERFSNPSADGQYPRVVVDVSVTRFLRIDETENLGRGWTPRVVSGRVENLRVIGGGGRARSLARDLWIWLPEGYDAPENAGRLYPVLYLLDGQNVFELNPSVSAAWRADEAVTRLVREGRMQPVIIVAVPHAGRFRMDEYLPFSLDFDQRVSDAALLDQGYSAAMRAAEPDAAGFLDFLAFRVSPLVQERYRVRTDAEGTAIGGGDVAATFAYYAATRYPARFGKVLLESMFLPILPGSTFASRLVSGRPSPAEVSFGFGDLVQTSTAIVGVQSRDVIAADVQAGRRLLATALNEPARMQINFAPGTGGGEVAYAQRLPRALEFLFPPLAGSEPGSQRAGAAPRE